MTLWVVIMAVVGLALFALLMPLRLALSGQAQGEADGSWAVAAGAELGPFAFAVVAARGVRPIFTLHALGRELLRRNTGATAAPSEAVEAEVTEQPAESQIEASPSGWWTRFKQRVDPIDLVAQVLTERRRFQIGVLDLTLAYSFRDVVLTGKIAGALYALSPLLPRRVTLRHTPKWDSVDRWEIAANGHLRLWPLLLLCDAIWYVLKVSIRTRPPSPQGAMHSP